jgi:hypothetical protein
MGEMRLSLTPSGGPLLESSCGICSYVHIDRVLLGQSIGLVTPHDILR